MDIEEIIAEVTPVERIVPICLRGDLVAEMELLERQLAQARANDAKVNDVPTAYPIAEEIERVQGLIEAATRIFRFRSIGGEAWEELAGQHPPSDAQRAEGFDYDLATFHPAAIAASCVDPEMDASQAVRLHKVIGSGQWIQLWNACHQANVGTDRLGKSVSASVTLQRSQPSSPTAAPEGSPVLSS